MFQKRFLTSIFTAFVFLIGTFAAAAQTAPVSGRVELEKADKSKVPVAGALVEVYRIDIKATLPSDKTDKKGNFSFAGLPLGAKFVLSISAPGCKPGYLPNVKAGDEKLLVTLQEGDGKRWTEQEIRDAISGANTATSSGNKGEMTAEQKKAQAEYEKQVTAVAAKNKETENKNVLIQKALTDGNAAFNAKDYDTAIAKYAEGINADPEYVGSAPILLNNKGVALKTRGVDAYNKAVKLTDPAEKSAGVAKAKEDLEGSLDSYSKAWTILKNAQPADIQNPANHEKLKYDSLTGLTEAYRLLVVTKLNVTKASDAKEAFDAYIAAETDPAKKAKVQLTYADIMREVGDSDKAIAAYRIVLQNTPDNMDAMAGLGLSLFNSGVVASDKAQMQEGLNFMQKFADTAPDTHPLKASVKEAVDYLKNTEKLAPQKVTTSTKKKT